MKKPDAERDAAIKEYRARRAKRLQARGYKPPARRFPEALLKQYNIHPGKSWTRQQAWSALQAAGCDIGQVYRELRDKRRAEAKDERH